MALRESERARALASGKSPSHRARRRALHYLVGTVVAVRRGNLAVAGADGGIHRVRLGRRTLLPLARPRAGLDHLRSGVDVRIAYVEAEDGELAVSVEVVAPVDRSPGGPPRRLFALALRRRP